MDTQALLNEFAQVQAHLNAKFQTVEPIRSITQKTGLLPAHLFIGTSTLVILLVSFNIGGAFFSATIGFAFPAYKSLLAIEAGGHAESVQWHSYWVVFGAFTVWESVIDLGPHLPFYYLLKIMVLMWCFLPSTKGATLIHQRFFKPLLQEYAGISPPTAGVKKAE